MYKYITYKDRYVYIYIYTTSPFKLNVKINIYIYIRISGINDHPIGRAGTLSTPPESAW